MAITYQGKGVTAAGLGAQTPGLPAGWAEKDIHVIVATTIGSQTYNTPGGYTLIGTVASQLIGFLDTVRIGVWYRRAEAGDLDPTVSGPASNRVNLATVIGWRGCVELGSPIDVSGTGSTATNDTTVTTMPAVTTTADGRMIVHCTGAGDSVTFSAFVNAALASITEAYQELTTDASDSAQAVAYGILTSAGGSGSFSATVSEAEEEANVTFALIPEPPKSDGQVSWAEFEVPAPAPYPAPVPVPRSEKPKYTVVAAARTPRASGPPEFFELGPLTVPTITWTDHLSRETSINLSVANVHRIEQPIKDRLRNIKKTPLEVIVYRGEEVMARGPVTARQVQGETLTITASGLLYYLRYMGITSDFSFVSTGQLQLVKDLVDGWQNLTYGDYGIDTSALGGGNARDRTYLARENQNVYGAVQALSTAVNGFDIDVDLLTRQLKLFEPKKGVDRSGEIILDARNIVNPNVFASAAAGSIATDVQATGVSIDDASPPVIALRSDPAGWVEFGRAFLGATFDNVSDVGTLEDYADFVLGERSDQVLTPGPELFPIQEVGVTDFDTGDLVAYNFDAGLGYESGDWRVLSKSVRVDAGGNEQMRVKFTAEFDPEDFS